MKTKLSKLCISIVCFILLINIAAFSKNYYIDPSSRTGIANGTWNNPWTFMNFWNSSVFLPGDTVFVRRGQKYPGDWYLNRSGTIGHPIVYMGYGGGSMPEINYSYGKETAIHLANVSYVVIDGMKITDPDLANDYGHYVTSKITSGIYLEKSNNCTIQNCDISLVGCGVSLAPGSNYNTITNNHIYNLRMIVNTPKYVNDNDDHGANGIGIESSNNTISYNKLEDNWAFSYDYGFDGGAIEFFGTTNNNSVMYNTSSYCSGFLEIGSSGDGTSNNNVFGYNIITNSGDAAYFHASGGNGFGTSVNNLQFYNNVIVVTANPYTDALQLFGSSGKAINGMLVLKNNIFWLTTGMNFTDYNYSPAQLIHSNNIFHMVGGNLVTPLNSSESLNAGKIFVDTTGDPSDWNFNLLPNITAVNSGINIGINRDFNGQPINGNPGAGIYVYSSSSNTALTAMSTAAPILCHGDSSSVNVNANGGLAPYSGIGTFTVNAGTYNYTVTDANGFKNITSVMINQPDTISAIIDAGDINVSGGSTTVYIAAKGGTGPFTYSLNGSPFQSMSTFSNVSAGTSSIVIKDANGCASTQSISIKKPGTVTNNDNFSIGVYPNPSTNYFTMSINNYSGNQPVEITVFNIVGSLMYKSIGVSANHQFSFGSDFVPGTYLLNVNIAGVTQTLKLVKP